MVPPIYNISGITSTNSSNSLPIQDDVFSDNNTIIEKTKTSTNNASISQGRKEVYGVAPSQDITVDAKCNLYEGKWIRDYRGPMYTNITCKTLPDLKNCGKYGKNQDYVNWRWMPNGCELPRFDPWTFLRTVKGKKLMFIGDSLARNMMESTLCLLSQAEVPADVYKDVKNKDRTFYFQNHDFTLMVIWSEFLVDGHEIIKNGTRSNTFSINMDKMHPRWAKILPELNYAVINNGNWFVARVIYIHKGGKLIGCVHCPPQENVPDISVASALRMVLRAALKYTSVCNECEDLLMVMRTYSMSHFENGSWFSGGYCNRTMPSEYGDEEMHRKEESWELWKVQMEEFERAKKGKRRRFEVMDVTKAMVVRADGHPGKHWIGTTSDCLHWCLPGPIDMWSELLLQIIRRRSL